VAAPGERIRGIVGRLEEGIIAAALAAMTLLTFVQVILRWFGTGWVWSLEVTTTLFAWLVLIGMAYGVRTRAHIGIDTLTRRLGARAARSVAIVVLGLCVAYSLLMMTASLVFVDRLLEVGHHARDIPLPRWLLTSALPIGFALLAWRFIEAGWRAFAPSHAEGWRRT
jgi:C4-dicarboxylate transporter, DctQ subunit